MSLLTNVLKLWRTGQYLLPADSGFMVKHLFASGELGFAKLDFSGFAGMYQDRARTIPYTAVEQPLGSFTGLNGVTATAPADVNRGVVSARVNLHTASEFPAGIAPTSSGVTAGSIAGYQGAIAFDAGATRYAIINNYTVLAGIEYVFSVVVQMTDGLAPNFDTSGTPGNDLELYIGTNNAGPIDPRTYSVVNLGSGTYRVSGRKVVNANSPNVGVWKNVTDSSRAFKVTAYDLRLATDAHLPYQRVNTPTDYDTAGFSHYLAFNGINTAYVTPSIDFTGTDKMTVWAGVTKLSDAGLGIAAELSAGLHLNTGAFYLAVPLNAGPNVGFLARGTVNTYSPAQDNTWPSPASLVATGQGLIGGAIPNILRTTGKPERTVADSIGTGNYGNYPLYIGARAGTSNYFNGRLYNLIVRGAQSSLSQIEATENLIRKTMRLP